MLESCLTTLWTYSRPVGVMLRWRVYGWSQEVKGELMGIIVSSAAEKKSWPAPTPTPTPVTFSTPKPHDLKTLWYFPHWSQKWPKLNKPQKKNMEKAPLKSPNLTFAHCQDWVYLVHPSSSLPLCPVLPLSTLPPERPSTLTCSSSPLVWTRDCSQDGRLQENETGMLFWLRPLRAGLLLHAS